MKPSSFISRIRLASLILFAFLTAVLITSGVADFFHDSFTTSASNSRTKTAATSLAAKTVPNMPAPVVGKTLLVNQKDLCCGISGYRPPGTFSGSWGLFSSSLNAAFGANNITVSTSDLSDLNALLSYDALLVVPRTLPISGTPGGSLTPTEISNLQAFVATGRRLVLFGENGNWGVWNSGILSAVGGTYSGTDVGLVFDSPILSHPLTTGVNTVVWNSDGVASGGTSLFQNNVATLWGANENALTLLSDNAVDDSFWFTGNNSQFAINIADWLASGPSLTPTLGNYSDASLPLSTNTIVTSDAPPTNATNINVSAPTDFKGKLEGDPATGVVRVTDAHPAGTFMVTVRAFGGSGVTTTKTFNLTVTTPATCVPVSFAEATNYGSVNSPSSVAVGDFNGDGKQDIATANFTSETVGVLLGDGAGGFGPATNFELGFHDAPADPRSVAVGDFNGDGKQDLAVADDGTRDVAILLGDGSGSFSPATNFDAGGDPWAIAVGDFNGDGKQDLAVANLYSSSISILLGDGAGGFTLTTNLADSTNPNAIAVGDFNRDGKQDLATSGSSGVSILLGDGAGGFSSVTNLSTGFGSLSIAVGDFDGDGKQDLAIANSSLEAVAVLLGDGAGGFGPVMNFDTGARIPFSVAVGDFNGDGKQDVATANQNSNDVSILLGDGMGGFGPATIFGVGLGPNSVAVGDFDGDGKQDLVTADYDSGTSVSILLRDCALTPPPTPYLTTTSLISSLNPSVAGQAVTFTANVTSGGGVPDGSVEFFDGSTSLGVVPLSVGNAALTVSTLSAGSHQVTAVYSGNSNFLGSTSAALTQTVTAPTPAGKNVTVQLSAGSTTVQLTFTNVSVAGNTTITPINPAAAGAVPGDFVINGSSLAFDIQTTATFTGKITVVFYMPSVTDPTVFNSLRIIHYVNGQPKVEKTTRDFAAKTISATVTSLSPFLTAQTIDHTPPVISGVVVTPSVLSPPNHKMVDVTVNYSVTDDYTPTAEIDCQLSVSSNEPINGTGDGDTAPDWVIVDAHHVQLRSERAGTGNGRVYTITIICTDRVGNSSSQALTVKVPKG